MELMEKVAYLKGLVDGLDIDMTTKEGKVLAAVMDVLNEMSDVMYEISDEVSETVDLVEAIDEDLGALEDDYYEEECECDECDDEAFDDYEEDEPMYECTCPSCGDTICLGESLVEEGCVDCLNCGQKLEFDYDESEQEDTEE